MFSNAGAVPVSVLNPAQAKDKAGSDKKGKAGEEAAPATKRTRAAAAKKVDTEATELAKAAGGKVWLPIKCLLHAQVYTRAGWCCRKPMHDIANVQTITDYTAENTQGVEKGAKKRGAEAAAPQATEEPAKRARKEAAEQEESAAEAGTPAVAGSGAAAELADGNTGMPLCHACSLLTHYARRQWRARGNSVKRLA